MKRQVGFSHVVLAVMAATGAMTSLAATRTLGRPFSDGCVLQCGRPVPVWGQAAVGDAVRVDFAGQVKRAVADAQGRWRVTLDPLTATERPQTLTVAPGLAAPQKVRYAWKYPWTGCVYNEVNLPLGTFEASRHQPKHHNEEQAK